MKNQLSQRRILSLGFSQAWAKMIDVESGYNPLVKDVALDSSGKIYAMVTYEQLDGTKVC